MRKNTLFDLQDALDILVGEGLILEEEYKWMSDIVEEARKENRLLKKWKGIFALFPKFKNVMKECFIFMVGEYADYSDLFEFLFDK